jgi:hypothetical protein
VALAIASQGCEDQGKASEQKAVDEVGRLLPVVKQDVDEVRKGMPEGAKKLATLLDPDPGNNLPGLQRAITGTRSAVKDLDVAKSTFFSFADTSGVVLRSEADPDLLARKSVLTAFPELKRALDPAADNVEVFGEMAEMRGVRTGPDTTWVVAHGVKDASGKLAGMFVTGWSFRRYAYRLEDQAKRDLLEVAQKNKEKKVPIVYVFALRGSKAYGAPVTPDVNAAAIEKLDLGAKLGSGPYRGQVEITGRTFGVAAQKTPDFAPDTGIAVMMSEI